MRRGRVVIITLAHNYLRLMGRLLISHSESTRLRSDVNVDHSTCGFTDT